MFQMGNAGSFMGAGPATPPGGQPAPTGLNLRRRPAGLGGSYPGAGSPGPAGSPQRTGMGAGPGPRPWEQGLRSPHNSPYMSQPAALSRDMSGGVRPGNNMMGGPSVGNPMGQGPSLDQIQAQMARRQVGAQLGPRNGALAGYMMG